MAEIETSLTELQSVSDLVAEYFCEDPNKFKLEECCSIFHSFCEKFIRAIQVNLLCFFSAEVKKHYCSIDAIDPHVDFLQENKDREMAEVKRRHRDRLENSAKRRSIATCSSRDKEMEGVALESALQDVLLNSVSRRRPGRPLSTHGSPVNGSPNGGSLSEITLQTNLPTGNRARGGSFRAMDLSRKEWNSAAELTENSPQNKAQLNDKDREKGGIPHKKEIKMFSKDNLRQFTRSDKITTNISSSARSFSHTIVDDEEALQDNNEEEAQKLREASKKVLRYQTSRSSVSSGEYSLENQKSPGAGITLPRQRTIDEDSERYPGDPTNEDLVRLLLNPQSPSKLNIVRRHTVSTPKVPKTEEEEDNLWTSRPVRTPNAVAGDKGTLPSKGAEYNSSNQVFDFSDVPQNFKNSDVQDQNSPSAQKKSKLNVSSTYSSDQVVEEKNQEGKVVEPTGSHVLSNTETMPSRSAWIKTETSGLFFSFLKRIGDISKLQSNKETVQKATGSGV